MLGVTAMFTKKYAWFGSMAILGIAMFGCKSGDEAGPAGASSAENAKDATITFASIQPILDKNCVGCHGENGKDGIDLRTYESVMKGGEHGAIVVAKDASGSTLVQALHGMNGVKQMPMKAPPLSASDIRKIEDWIAGGAKS